MPSSHTRHHYHDYITPLSHTLHRMISYPYLKQVILSYYSFSFSSPSHLHKHTLSLSPSLSPSLSLSPQILLSLLSVQFHSSCSFPILQSIQFILKGYKQLLPTENEREGGGQGKDIITHFSQHYAV